MNTPGPAMSTPPTLKAEPGIQMHSLGLPIAIGCYKLGWALVGALRCCSLGSRDWGGLLAAVCLEPRGPTWDGP